MRNILFTLALLVSVNLSSQGNTSKWNSKMYELYDAKDFMKLEIVNSKVDFSNIQYELLSASPHSYLLLAVHMLVDTLTPSRPGRCP